MLPQSLSEQPVGIALPQICRNKLLGVPIENQCVKGGGLLYGGNSAVPTRIVGTENWHIYVRHVCPSVRRPLFLKNSKNYVSLRKPYVILRMPYLSLCKPFLTKKKSNIC